MTAQKLIEKLQEFPGHIPVIATWEGQEISITPGRVTIDDSEPIRRIVIDSDKWCWEGAAD